MSTLKLLLAAAILSVYKQSSRADYVKSLTCIGYGMTVEMDPSDQILEGFYNRGGIVVVLDKFYNEALNASAPPSGNCSWALNSTDTNFTLSYAACDLKVVHVEPNQAEYIHITMHAIPLEWYNVNDTPPFMADYKFNVVCNYETQILVTASPLNANETNPKANDTENTGSPYVDLNFQYGNGKNVSGPVMPKTEIVLHIILTDETYAAILPYDCKFSDSSNPSDSQARTQPFIEEGCPDDTAPSKVTQAKLNPKHYTVTFRAFRFDEQATELFVSCTINVCTQSPTGCENSCWSNSKRFMSQNLAKFRQADQITKVGLTKKLMIATEDQPGNSNKTSENSQLPYIIIGVVGGVALVALVAVMVGLRMRKRKNQNRMQPIRIPRPIHVIPPNEQKSYQNFA